MNTNESSSNADVVNETEPMSQENSSEDKDFHNSTFYFESDHVALKGEVLRMEFLLQRNHQNNRKVQIMTSYFFSSMNQNGIIQNAFPKGALS